MKRRNFIRLGFLILLLALMVVSLSFTTLEMRKLPCTKVQVEIRGDRQYITADQVEKLLDRKMKKLTGCLIDTLDSERMEKILEKHPWIKNAEVYKGIEKGDQSFLGGCLNIRIEQPDPIMKVMNGSDILYVDATGRTMPFPENDTKNVPVVTGHNPLGELDRGLRDFVQYLNENKFWRAQIQQIHVLPGHEFLLVPRLGGQIIEMGSLDGFEQKLVHLKALYEQDFVMNGWNRYKKISLKWDGQIVCTRKNEQ
ncbi:MAG TPA: FtsQ-type POTRA domain-containing protein [Prolixibacteraceae bacterium]|nr:FtsQ-type POTRA domain-containing protein [Prolixibacteraceae bacterium]